jgi:hypothetical protein
VIIGVGIPPANQVVPIFIEHPPNKSSVSVVITLLTNIVIVPETVPIKVVPFGIKEKNETGIPWGVAEIVYKVPFLFTAKIGE